MARTHPETLQELFLWMREDAQANRQRGGGSLSVIAVTAFRLNQFGVRATGLVPTVVRALSLPLVAFSRLMLGCELPGSPAYGRRLVLPHGGRGVMIAAGSVVGDDAVFAPWSGLGVAYPAPGAPVLQDGVYVGTSATILGAITLGQGSFIGARALVPRDVLAGQLAVGLPAKAVGPAPVHP